MATCQINPIVRHLRRAVLIRDGATLTDEQLLESFVTRKDQTAFEALLRRHGPMVLGVCRRILRNHHDAEDAFQATFLVLVRKADSIVPRAMVANWLYGVAQTTALRARVAAAKRAVRERQVPALPEPEAVQPDRLWQELRPLLDQELSCLPAKYRVPIILCDLENKSTKEAARNLGWPQGTLAGRLARGRTMLAKRLSRRGLTLSGGALAAALSQNVSAGSVPPSLTVSTIKAAGLLAAGQPAIAGVVPAKVAALMEGVMKAMLIAKLKTATVVLAVVLAGVGSSGLLYRTQAADAPKAPQADERAAAIKGQQVRVQVQEKKHPAETDEAELQGHWQLVGGEVDGEEFDTGGVGKMTVDGERLILPEPVSGLVFFKLDATKKPKQISLIMKREMLKGIYTEKTLKGIYSVDGDDLKLCYGRAPDVAPPSEFGAKKGSNLQLFIFKRRRHEPVGFGINSDAGLTGSVIVNERNFDIAKKEATTAKPPPRVVEKRFKQYHVECTLAKVDPNGKDLGEDGKGKVLAKPELVIPEGKEGKFLAGGDQAVPGDKDNAVEFVEFGISVRFKATGMNDGRVRLETVLEKTELDRDGRIGDIQIRGTTVRSIARLKLGESVKLVAKDDRGQPRHWVRIKVVTEESVISRNRSAKAGVTRNPTFQDVGRRLGMSDINLFMFAEALQGQREGKSVADFARDFGMKEIDVFLLQEALRRDGARE